MRRDRERLLAAVATQRGQARTRTHPDRSVEAEVLRRSAELKSSLLKLSVTICGHRSVDRGVSRQPQQEDVTGRRTIVGSSRDDQNEARRERISENLLDFRAWSRICVRRKRVDSASLSPTSRAAPALRRATTSSRVPESYPQSSDTSKSIRCSRFDRERGEVSHLEANPDFADAWRRSRGGGRRSRPAIPGSLRDC